jgi:two-component system, NtrC family, nitrogen regulation response regulator GlnG
MVQGKTDASTDGLSGTLDARLLQNEVRLERRVPALTLLYHPNADRAGEWVLLQEIPLGHEALVSRHSPELSSSLRPVGEPLADRYVSRQPIRIGPAPAGGLVLTPGDSRTRVEVDGLPVLQAREIPAAAVERGVVVTLSGRIVLLLHYRQSLPLQPSGRFGLMGESDGMFRVRTDIGRVADLSVPVLIRGETGTGKELVARGIHDAGPRRAGPFLAVNLGALSPSLVASELFGAVKGAFTGSVQSQEGYFRRAHGGTLFLDEIGEAPPELQAALLRVLETGEVFAVGSQTPQRVDVRVLAATDADLAAKVSAGEFRAPLLHRLAGYEVWLPPLRERREDVGLLFFHFLRQELQAIGEAHQLTQDLWVPPELVARLAAYDWPGNVRQLRNVARQLAIGSRGLPRLQAGPTVERLLATPPAPDPAREAPASLSASRRKPSEVGEEELLDALRAHRWDLQATAEHLRISRPSLYARIESSPRIRKAGDLSTDEIAVCYKACGGDLNAMVDRLEVSRKALARRLREMKLDS